MPITLGCPSCGKRFRARDESAGKRVKCPYCAEPVPVPSGDEPEPIPQHQQMPPERSPLDDDGIGDVPTSRPAPPVAPGSFTSLGAPPAVASPTDWGADPAPPPPPRPNPSANPAPGGNPSPFPPIQSPPAAPVFPSVRAASSPDFDPFPKVPPARPGRESLTRLGAAPRPLGTGVGAGPSGPLPDDMRSADPIAIPGWRKARGGMFWVLLGLLVLTIPGLVGFAKAACVKSGVALPQGPGDGWISIAGYVNSPEPNSMKLTKEELLDVVVYGLPAVIGGLFLTFGRLTCGAVPRSCGGKGMFVLSGLFTLIAVVGLIAAFVCHKLLFSQEYQYARYAFLIATLTAEFLFLTGLAVCGMAMKRPKAARSVGMVGLAVAFVATLATIGWMVYVNQYQPKPVTEMAKMYEQAAVMLGWLFVVGMYWRAARNVRGAVSEYLETVEV
ncbi:MAG: hypothetical protein C0467_25785 [Planctomycetaceae bacterium]|nr:hypothetical protein [Planctomycetaceae bacterium]